MGVSALISCIGLAKAKGSSLIGASQPRGGWLPTLPIARISSKLRLEILRAVRAQARQKGGVIQIVKTRLTCNARSSVSRYGIIPIGQTPA